MEKCRIFPTGGYEGGPPPTQPKICSSPIRKNFPQWTPSPQPKSNPPIK